jgi:hypothetical protein
LQHRNVTDEVALPGGGENLLRAIPRFEDFDFAAQDNGQPETALPCSEDELATRESSALSEWLKQRELPIIEFPKGNALRIAVKLLVVLIFFSHEIDCVGKSWSGSALRVVYSKI